MQRNNVFSSSIVIIGSAAFFYFLSSLRTGFCLPSSPAGTISILVIALVSTFLAIYIFFIGLKLIGPVNASMLSTFEPVTTVLIFYLVFSRSIGPLQTIGTLMILTSAIIMALSGQQNTQNRFLKKSNLVR